MKFLGYSWQEPSKRGNIFNMISQLGENSDNEEILDRLFGTPKASVQLNPLFWYTSVKIWSENKPFRLFSFPSFLTFNNIFRANWENWLIITMKFKTKTKLLRLRATLRSKMKKLYTVGQKVISIGII